MKKTFRKAFGILAIATAISSTTYTLVSCEDNTDNKGKSDEKVDEEGKEDNSTTSDFKADPKKFEGTIKSGVVTLDATQEYKLTGPIYVEKGAKLVIPAGTVIVGTGGTKAFIGVKQGGKIEAKGTADKPVVFTGSEKKPGNWGGIVLCGEAPINRPGGTAVSEVASTMNYGGQKADDNSGILQYVRIEYAGASFNSEKEFNGLSLFGVGNGTTIDHVQLHFGSDDGIEFFGGTVNASNIISNDNEDDQFDWTEGWSGKGTNWYGKEDVAGERGNRGIEADNNSDDHKLKPISNPTIVGLTLIGRTKEGYKGKENQAIKLRVGTQGKLENVVLKDFKTGFDIENDVTLQAVKDKKLIAKGVAFFGVKKQVKFTNDKKEEVKNIKPTDFYTIDESAKGAGNGVDVPDWAKGWTIGLK